VFVVGCDLERDPRGRERAAEVLALGTGLRWHLEESGKARKAAASDAEAGARAGCVTSHDVAPYLETTCHDYNRADGFTMVGKVSATIAARFGNSRNNHEECVAQPVAGTIGNRGLRSHTELDGHGADIPVAFSQNQREEVREVEVPGALAAEPGTHQQTYIAQPVPYDLFQITAPVNRQNRKPGDPCHTLARDNAAHAAVVGTDLYNGAITGDVAATMGTPGSSVNASGPTVMAFKPGQSAEARSLGAQVDVACTLEAGGGGNNKQAVAFHPTQDPISSSESSHALGTGSKGGCATAAVAQAMTVRRLTPRECERLQGFPDDWTLIPWREKPAEECPDGPRYKALGNSMAVNCMAWIGERIAAAEGNP